MSAKKPSKARARGRPRQAQIRIGKVERAIIDAALRFLKKGPRPRSPGTMREAAFTAAIATHCPTRGYLAEYPITGKPKKTSLFGQSFFPDLWIVGPNRKPLMAIEVKKLSTHHKASFKEALAQAAVYSTQYKCVALVLYDYSPGKIYKTKLGPGNRGETRLSGKLRSNHRVNLLIL